MSDLTQKEIWDIAKTIKENLKENSTNGVIPSGLFSAIDNVADNEYHTDYVDTLSATPLEIIYDQLLQVYTPYISLSGSNYDHKKQGVDMNLGDNESTWDTTIEYDHNTRTATLNGDVYVKGNKYSFSDEKLEHSQIEGLWYYYLDSNGVFTVSQNAWTNPFEIAFLMLVDYRLNDYWDYYEERHGSEIDLGWHNSQHSALDGGTRLSSNYKPVVTNVVEGGANPVTPSDSDNLPTILEHVIYDEDIQFKCKEIAGDYIILSKTSDWLQSYGTSETIFDISGTYPNYNNINSGEMLEVPNNSYYSVFILSKTSRRNGFSTVFLQGQTYHDKYSDATLYNVSDLNLAGLPFAEFVIWGKLIYKTSSSYSTTGSVGLCSYTFYNLTRNSILGASLPEHSLEDHLNVNTTNYYGGSFLRYDVTNEYWYDWLPSLSSLVEGFNAEIVNGYSVSKYNATSDTDRFCVFDDNTIAYRNGDQVLSDINAISNSEKGAANGVATLDSGAKIPISQLPSSIMVYKGTWDASTNTPTIVDGTGESGWFYVVSTSGTQDLGHGSIAFNSGDQVIYNGTIWERSGATISVTTVNGYTGDVVLNYSDVGAEQAFSKNTAFNKDFGTSPNTVCEGDDIRVNNGQTAYSWGDHAGLYAPLSHVGSTGSAHGVVTALTNGFMTSADKTKLDGIANNANNYVHPSTHPATMIVEDIDHLFVTEGEISLWTNVKVSNTRSINTGTGLTGGGNLTADITISLASSGVAAGTYNNSATQVKPFTVDATGRITAVGSGVTITPAWSSITSKPSTFTPSTHAVTHRSGQGDAIYDQDLNTTNNPQFNSLYIYSTKLQIFREYPDNADAMCFRATDSNNYGSFKWYSQKTDNSDDRLVAYYRGDHNIWAFYSNVNIHLPLDVTLDDNGLMASFGDNSNGTTYNDYVYISDVNEINSGYNVNNDNAVLYLNHRGYQRGSSYYRDLRIQDGKGSDMIYVDGSAGSVGINTSSPNSAFKLDVSGDQRATRLALGAWAGSFDTYRTLQINKSNGSSVIENKVTGNGNYYSNIYTNSTDGTSTSYVDLLAYSNYTNGTSLGLSRAWASFIQLYSSQNRSCAMGTSSYSDLILSTNNTPRVTIYRDGSAIDISANYVNVTGSGVFSNQLKSKIFTNETLELSIDDFSDLYGLNYTYECANLRDDFHSFVTIDNYSDNNKYNYLILPQASSLTIGTELLVTSTGVAPTDIYICGYTNGSDVLELILASETTNQYSAIKLSTVTAYSWVRFIVVTHYGSNMWLFLEGSNETLTNSTPWT